LSGDNITKIFTGVITSWNDPAIAADNPLLALPNKKIVPVVRSDGSGSTAQFTRWMISQHADIWNPYCQRSGRAPACGMTSYYPTVPGMIAQAGDLGVAGYVAQSYADGAIGYVNYSYALNAGFPVAKMLNAADYYTEPTPNNVAVSLLKAQINTDPNSPDYLTQQLEGVYTDNDPRAYPLSSYSYMILPATVQGQFNTAKGKTLAAFSYYAMCQGQQESASLGYSPMPINLVQASFDQIRKIPGAVVQNINIQSCNNPTFSPDGTNLLAKNAPFPPDCDKRGPIQCLTGTGGTKGKQTAATKAGAAAALAGARAGGAGARSGPGGTGPGGTGGGGAGGGGTAGAGTTDSSVAAGADQSAPQCDPDTGVCTTDSSNSGSSRQSANAQPVSVGAGGTGTLILMMLVGLFTVALVLAPALTSWSLRRWRST
jgi:phosphate transport system substrate-binding protein